VKRKPVLKKQVVEKKKKGKFSDFLRTARKISTWAFRGSLLLVGLVAISWLFVSLYHYMLASPYIRLKQVVLTGVDENLKAELLDMAKLNFDMSLLTIDLNDLKGSLERHPWVRSVNLEKHFPHTLMIWAEKETPRAIVAMDKLYYMNRGGKIFKTLDQGDETDFPVVTGISKDDEEREKLIAVAVDVLKALEGQGDPWSLKNLSELHVRKDGDVALHFSHLPARIRIRGNEVAERMDDLGKVVKHLSTTGRAHMARAIDLSYEEGGVVQFKKN
jgi:cell division septal protein FtsQ